MVLSYKQLGKEIPVGNALIDRCRLRLSMSVKRRDLVRYLEQNGFLLA